LPGDKLLGVGQLEACFQHLAISQMVIARQQPPDRGRDRIMPFSMPSKMELGLLLQVFEVRHGALLLM
jgi:hypothetical protein